ncbi:hypothetical protein [Arthrobacter sp. BPSS-3]|uniref:hypothetical protein n=1 Tax=Arthrobacter sp. BPSS-3 TaxID=3366580 RepID=UPI0037DD305D
MKQPGCFTAISPTSWFKRQQLSFEAEIKGLRPIAQVSLMPFGGTDTSNKLPRLYCHRVKDEQSKTTGRFSLRLPNDKKLFWVYLPTIALVVIILVGISDDADSDTKVQALTVLGLAAASLLVCFRWAFRLWRAPVSTVDYIKGTTASRTMLWFWGLFGSISLLASLTGIGGDSFTPVWESAIWTFAGAGSVLLTAGPAYKEYREAMGTADATRRPRSVQQQRTGRNAGGVTPSRHGLRSRPLLVMGLAAVAVLAARRGWRRPSKHRSHI